MTNKGVQLHALRTSQMIQGTFPLKMLMVKNMCREKAKEFQSKFAQNMVEINLEPYPH